MAMMSPGVEVNEIDLSIVVPTLGNATACFAGVFTKGPSDKYLLITNAEELIQYYGGPTNANYNDWFQCYNFLQYANKLLVSRAVDANGSWDMTTNEVFATNENGKVEVTNAPVVLKVGSYIKFNADAEAKDTFKIAEIEAPVTAVSQVSTIKVIGSLADTEVVDLTLSNVGTTDPDDTMLSSFTSVGGSTSDEAASALAADINSDANGITATATGSVITMTSNVAGVAFDVVKGQGPLQDPITVTENVPGESYELVLEDLYGVPVSTTLGDNPDTVGVDPIAAIGGPVYVRLSSMNAIVDAPIGATDTEVAKSLRSGDELKYDSKFVANDEQYEVAEMSLPVNGDTKLKFMAKSSGSAMNKIEIAIARQADFASGKAQAFSGLPLNDFFEAAPVETKGEIAIIIRYQGEVKGTYIVSTIPGSKDYRNKSNYVEDIINKYDALVYVKDNTLTKVLPQSRLASIPNVDGTFNETQQPLMTSNGTDGRVNVGDIMDAYGDVHSNTIFGNKEELDIDIVIANEAARVTAGKLASERADCICFIGAKFEDVVGLPSAKIVENLIADAMTGDLNNASTANSFCATFGNYKQQYDKFNDKMRWVSVAGDVAGLRAGTNTSLNTWWASAGLDRGQIKNAQKIAFNPNLGQRDFLYKNKINPVVSFPGQGNAIVWGQKTLQSKPSAFDRINVRGLFNTLERAISRMAKYYLFEFNDVYTRNRFVATIEPFLEGVKAGRGVYDFYVRCDETNNTSAVIDANRFVCDIAVKPTRVAEFITLNFVAVGTGVEFSEIFV